MPDEEGRSRDNEGCSTMINKRGETAIHKSNRCRSSWERDPEREISRETIAVGRYRIMPRFSHRLTAGQQRRWYNRWGKRVSRTWETESVTSSSTTDLISLWKSSSVSRTRHVGNRTADSASPGFSNGSAVTESHGE